jgi:hypothetical protein
MWAAKSASFTDDAQSFLNPAHDSDKRSPDDDGDPASNRVQ